MATLALVAAAALLALAARELTPRIRARLRRRRRQVECDRCYRELPASRAVTIANTTPPPDQPPGLGGSAMVAHYHRRCARAEGVLDRHPDHRP